MAGNPNAIRQLMSNRDVIRKLMAREKDMDQIAQNAINEGRLTGGEEGATFIPSDTPQVKQNAQQIVVNEEVMKRHSRMPKQILESFQKNPGKDSPLPSGMGGSVLDGFNISQPVTQKQVVQESTQPTMQATGAIDYSLIKTIINESVKENVKKYVTAMYKKLSAEQKALNEANTIKAIKLGDNFSLITENQDVYSCKPTFRRNIND